MPIDELTAALEREASLREESLIRDAERRAETLLDEARASAALMGEKERKLRQERERLAARLRKSNAALKARLRQGTAGQKLVERLNAMTVELFRAFMQSERYPEWLAAAVARGAAGLGDDYTVVADPLSGAVLNKKNSRPLSVDEGIEGFILLADEGRVRIDATVEKRLAKVWRLNAPSFVAELEGLIHDQL